MIVVVGALTGASVWWRPAGAPLWLDVAFAVLSLVAAVVQWRWPVSGTLAATVLAAVSPAATPVATTGALQVAQRNRFAVAAGVASAGFGAHVVRGWWRPDSGISLGWWLALILATYGALLGWGALARSRRALLISLHERAVRAEAEQGRRVAEARMAERRTLAREMHDVLAHRLSLVATHAGALEYRPDASPEQVAKAAGVVRAGVHQALEELREVIGLLHEDDADPATTPQPTLADLPRLIDEAREAGQPIDLRDELSLTPDDASPTGRDTSARPGTASARPDATFPPAIGRAAYRVVQEGLTNARKHAPGQPVAVLLHGTPGTRLLIDISNPLLTAASPSAATTQPPPPPRTRTPDALTTQTASASKAPPPRTDDAQFTAALGAAASRADGRPSTAAASARQPGTGDAQSAATPGSQAPRADGQQSTAAPNTQHPSADGGQSTAAPNTQHPSADGGQSTAALGAGARRADGGQSSAALSVRQLRTDGVQGAGVQGRHAGGGGVSGGAAGAQGSGARAMPGAQVPRAGGGRTEVAPGPREDTAGGLAAAGAGASGLPGAGVGLVGLTERVRVAGGRLDHQVTEGRFVLRASLPWPA